jgi:glyceraldehyde 3-phosphate dehydrogenase
MAIKVGINGFGRIGRLVFRAAFSDPDIDIVAVNDITNSATLAHLLKYDTNHGIYEKDIEVPDNNTFIVDGKKVVSLEERDPSKLPWKELGVDIVVESTGLFRKREQAAMHLEAGAKKVIISAPATGPDITIVMGVNHKKYDPEKHHILSNASCTTNCYAPVTKVIMEKFGIVKGLMTTVHAYTNDQRILDLPHKDLRRARAAGVSMIPTTTGAAKAVGEVIPELKGKLNAMSIRVPVPNVALVDAVYEVEKNVTVEEVNAALKEAAEGELKGIMAYEEKPLVSHDYNHTSVSSTVDALSTMVVEGNLVKVLAWYDNEWGFSNRVVDLVRWISK